MIRNESFIAIQGWMINELNLKGTELLCYAVIYGFSQDGETWYTGSRQYLADWCNCSIRNIQTALNSLVDKGYLLKETKTNNGVKYCNYAINFTSGEETSYTPDEKSSHNNIAYNNIVNNNSIANAIELYSSSGENYQFGKQQQKKKSLFEKCSDVILAFTKNKDLQTALFDYLDFILKKAKEENKSFFTNNFKGMMNELKKLGKNDNEYLDIVNQSIIKGYWGFFPVNSSKSKNINNLEKIENNTNRPKARHEMTEEEYYSKKAKDKNGNIIEF